MTIDIGQAFEAHAPAIRRYLLRLTQNADVADELLSQVFESAVRAAHRYEDRGHPITSWLYDIARSRLVDHLRRERRRAHFVDIEDCHLSDDGGIGAAERRLDAAPLLGLLDELPTSQRAVLQLRFLEDRSLTQIATQLGRSVGAVKALQHRGLMGLQQLLPVQGQPGCQVCGEPIAASGLCHRHYAQRYYYERRGRLPPWERETDTIVPP